MSNNEIFNVITSLLKQTTSLVILKQFLQGKEIAFSAGSWDEFITNRLSPAYNNNIISLDELIDLLKDSEEHGKQHTFLFKIDKDYARKIVSKDYIVERANSKGYADVINNPIVLEKPDQLTVTDVRWERSDNQESVIVKMIEQRERDVFLGIFPTEEGYDRRYRKEYQRVIHILKVHSYGLIEVRVATDKNVNNYMDSVRRVINNASLFMITELDQLSLSPAKNRIWNEKDVLSSEIRYTNTSLRNDNGMTMSASASVLDTDLTGDDGVRASIDAFIEHDGYCEGANIWFTAGSPLPSRDVHVLLGGDENEFAINASCTSADYAYVMNRILALNV